MKCIYCKKEIMNYKDLVTLSDRSIYHLNCLLKKYGSSILENEKQMNENLNKLKEQLNIINTQKEKQMERIRELENAIEETISLIKFIPNVTGESAAIREDFLQSCENHKKLCENLLDE